MGRTEHGDSLIIPGLEMGGRSRDIATGGWGIHIDKPRFARNLLLFNEQVKVSGVVDASVRFRVGGATAWH